MPENVTEAILTAQERRRLQVCPLWVRSLVERMEGRINWLRMRLEEEEGRLPPIAGRLFRSTSETRGEASLPNGDSVGYYFGPRWDDKIEMCKRDGECTIYTPGGTLVIYPRSSNVAWLRLGK